MKKILYSGLAIIAAVAGVAATKANSHRANIFFRYIGPTSASTPSSAVTTLSNWTLTIANPAANCPASSIACGIEAASGNVQTIIVAGVPHQVPRKVYTSPSHPQQATTGGGNVNDLVFTAYNQDNH